ncbi:SMI1/KNR4 family protein [Shewanella putrefaciens]|uniref:SMI1/KNR4 family protein n=1 Tax=Shewanella putrefaciens TaxID=24 RepID=UPI0021C226D8|nr:SMI1/KNR4 family protein [Shewanella putrefaciens]UXK09530.1 SMI1/KNR4 family protein [Shewanella putrefaciens]
MNRAFGKIFKSETGVEYGVIRKAKEPFPEVLSTSNVLAEDDCGNYFILSNEAVCFWDHETGENAFLSKSVDDFVSMCSAPEEAELEPSQIESAWIDPEFAKQIGIKSKP